jgi:Fe-S-cluster containining protein
VKELDRIIMNACAACPDKGRCCREFYISKDGIGILSDSLESVSEYVAKELELPFTPLYNINEFGWVFKCDWLREDGRCGDYEHRPELCRLYHAGSSLLCLMSPQLVTKIEAD